MDLRRNSFLAYISTKGETFREGKFPFLFCILFLIASPLYADAPSRLNDRMALSLDALAFFEKDEDHKSLEILVTRIVEDPQSHVLLLKAVLKNRVSSKDRAALLASMRAMVAAQKCREKMTPVCEELKTLWQGNLDSIVFFESTAGRLEQARRQLITKECKLALGILKEIEAKEGAYKTLLEMYGGAYSCLGDEQMRGQVEMRLDEMNLFVESPKNI